MKLDRNINSDGKGKYALIRMQDIPTSPRTPEELAEAILENPECVVFGTGTEDGFFAIMFKDVYAEHALYAYAGAALSDDSDYAGEVAHLAAISHSYPLKKKPDSLPFATCPGIPDNTMVLLKGYTNVIGATLMVFGGMEIVDIVDIEKEVASGETVYRLTNTGWLSFRKT